MTSYGMEALVCMTNAYECLQCTHMHEIPGSISKHLQQHGSVTFVVHVRPGAARTEVKEELGDGSVKVSVAAKPEGGKANAELIRFLAEEFGVAKSGVAIILGKTARQKVVRISGVPR